ncbi:Putative ribonuclease H protein At1g65750 [Linum perenne]
MLKDTSNNIKFCITNWLLWRARNKLIFEKLNQTPSAVGEQCEFWTSLVLSSYKTNQLGREVPSLARHAQLIAWRLGDEGWSTVNTYGSRISHTGAMSIGELIRDEKGGFVCAFCANIGNCSITRPEFRAIVEGLKLVCSLNIRKVTIQTDSWVVVSILQKEEGPSSQHVALIVEFHELISRDWELSLSHVYREANCAADYLANIGHSYSVGMYFNVRTPLWLTSFGMT